MPTLMQTLESLLLADPLMDPLERQMFASGFLAAAFVMLPEWRQALPGSSPADVLSVGRLASVAAVHMLGLMPDEVANDELVCELVGDVLIGMIRQGGPTTP